MPTYKKNFLVQVIFQVHFEPIASLKIQPKDFVDSIKDRFVFDKELEIKRVEAEIGESQSMSMRKLKNQWVYASLNDKKTLTIGDDIFSLEYTKFHKQSEAFDDLHYLWEKFLQSESVSIEEAKNIGVRYINQIEASGNPLEWSELIDERLCHSLFSVSTPEGFDANRSMNQFAYTDGDADFRMFYGIWNPEYPSPISKKQFILDYDCRSIGATESSEILPTIRQYSELIHITFESNIQEGLRDIMGVLNEQD